MDNEHQPAEPGHGQPDETSGDGPAPGRAVPLDGQAGGQDTEALVRSVHDLEVDPPPPAR